MIITIIIINTLVMLNSGFITSYNGLQLLSKLDWIFIALFILEILLKVIAIGPFKFWQKSFNKFDVFLLVITVLARFISEYAYDQISMSKTFTYFLLDLTKF